MERTEPHASWHTGFGRSENDRAFPAACGQPDRPHSPDQRRRPGRRGQRQYPSPRLPADATLSGDMVIDVTRQAIIAWHPRGFAL